MAIHSLRLLLLLLVTIMAQPPSTKALLEQTSQPIPAGRTAANRATRQAEQQVEPPATVAENVPAAEVMQQANELLSLAQQVHSDTERATQGVVAKDLKDKLKRIEKLSKRLRDELAL
jgi:hypothetical protein